MGDGSGLGFGARDSDGRAGLLVKWKPVMNQQRLRLQPSTNVRGCASGGGAPRALINERHIITIETRSRLGFRLSPSRLRRSRLEHRGWSSRRRTRRKRPGAR